MMQSTHKPMQRTGCDGSRRKPLGPIVSGMEVCDVEGYKLGTVAHVHVQDDRGSRAAPDPSQPVPHAVIEVRTGFLDRARPLYIPLCAVHDVTADCIFLASSGEEIDDADWRTRPSFLDRGD